MRKSSEGPALSIGLFQKVQRKMIYFPYVVRKNVSDLSNNCSIHGKNCEISGLYNFWTSVKSNIPNVWNWIFWGRFGSEIEVGGLCPLPVAPALKLLSFVTDVIQYSDDLLIFCSGMLDKKVLYDLLQL